MSPCFWQEVPVAAFPLSHLQTFKVQVRFGVECVHPWRQVAHLCFPSFGQWGHEKGKGYYKVSSWLLISDQHFTDQGEIDPNATRGQFNVNFYGEYGLTDKWDLVAYIPFFVDLFSTRLKKRLYNFTYYFLNSFLILTCKK